MCITGTKRELELMRKDQAGFQFTCPGCSGLVKVTHDDDGCFCEYCTKPVPTSDEYDNLVAQIRTHPANQ